MKPKHPNPTEELNHTFIPKGSLHLARATLHFLEENYNQIVTQENLEIPPYQNIELSEYDKTPEGFIDLMWEHHEVLRSLHLDLEFSCMEQDFDQWPQELQNRAHAKINEINQHRTNPVTLEEIDRSYLFKLAEPNWEGELSDSSIENWPEDFQPDLEELRDLDAKLNLLSQDEELKKQAREIIDSRSEIIKAAFQIKHTERRIDQLADQISQIKIKISKIPGQKLSPGKAKKITLLEQQMAELQVTKYQSITSDSDDFVKAVTNELRRIEAKELKKQLDKGLVLTQPMATIIDQATPSILKGNPALFIGETGGAKTALAKYICREIIGKEPEIVSGYADVNGYQLMGKSELRTEDGATVSEFINGPVIRAMEEGRPLILDEINAMPPEFLKRLNEITQLRPGESMTIQEDSGREVMIKPGFCIIATANEKSKRYLGVNEFSTEFRNRFTANNYHISYPDNDVVIGEYPEENAQIAYASAVDETGKLILPEGQEVLDRFIKVAHITQRLFVGSIDEGLDSETLGYIDTASISEQGTTALKENVLAPRTLVALITKVIDAGTSLDTELSRWVDAIKESTDKKILTTILKAHGFLNEPIT